jgi:hypothetical protein
MMSRNLVRFERYLVPMIPFLAMPRLQKAAAIEGTGALAPDDRAACQRQRRLIAALLIAGEPLITTTLYDGRLRAADVRTQAVSGCGECAARTGHHHGSVWPADHVR